MNVYICGNVGEQNVNMGMWECGNVGMWVTHVATAKMWECGNVGEQNVKLRLNQYTEFQFFVKTAPRKLVRIRLTKVLSVLLRPHLK
jgi:hypothetical protein